MKIGYVRCSTDEQNPARQQEMLKEQGCERVFMDMMSGKNRERPGLQEMLQFVRDGDTVYVESFSRLARSTKDLLNIVDELQQKNVKFISQKERIDTDTPQGKFMLTVFAALAEMEREQMLQRQAEGIAIAKREGKYKGRQPIPIDKMEFEELYKKWKAGDITQKYMCKRLNIGRTTLYHAIKHYESNKKG